MQKQVKVKKDDGLCNICLKRNPLTDDHIPPKGTGNYQRTRILTVFEQLASQEPPKANFISQNGVKYKTICRSCNSLLGRYDRAFIEFSAIARQILESQVILPSPIRVKCNLYRISRSLIGHFLAAKPFTSYTKFDKDAREIVLDEKELSDDMNILYWLYPYYGVSVVCEALMPAIRGGPFNEFISAHILKFYPVAFMLADKNEYEGLDVIKGTECNTDEEQEILLSLEPIRGFFWPEHPSADSKQSFLAGGAGLAHSIFASPDIERFIQKGIPKL